MNSIRRKRTLALTTATLAVAALLAVAVSAHAVNSQGQPVTTPGDPSPGVVTSYSFGSYMLTGQDIVFEYELTFPAGFDITDAAPADPAATVVAKDVGARRLHLRLNEPWARPDRIMTFIVSGVRNAPTADTYPMPDIRFLVGQQNRPDNPPAWESLPAGDIVLIGSHLNVTLSASMLEFELTPDVPAAPQDVTVTIDSSHEYTITREVNGDASLFGLDVSGQATGAKPAGPATFVDTYSAQVPWTTEGDRTYTATVTYTIVQ